MMQTNGKYVLAVDHGTSGIKSAIISIDGKVMDSEKEATPILFFENAGAEQDPDTWWSAFLRTAKILIERGSVSPSDIEAVCVSSTFSTTLAVDEKGNSLMNALTWMDGRGAPYIKKVMSGFPSVMGYGLANVLKWVKITGGGPALSGKDDIAHVLLVKNRFPDIYRKTHKFLSSKDFLNLKLCGEFKASYDSMTLFWVTDTRDINNVKYDDDLINRFGIDRAKLPEMVSSTEILGKILPEVAEKTGLSPYTKVVCGSPDHQAACIGAGGVKDFKAHLYIGTSSWLQCIVPFKKTDVLHSIASLPTSIPGKYYCANEQDLAGGCLDYLAKQFFSEEERKAAGKNDIYKEIDRMALLSPPGANKLIFAPWLNGERTPVDDDMLRGAFFNIQKTTNKNDFCRAVMEGVAFNTKWSMKYIEKFVKTRLDPINFVGGGALSDVWCEIMADILDRTIYKVKNPEWANGRGAAFIAGVGLGRMEFSDIPEFMEYEKIFEPRPEFRQIYDKTFKIFLGFYKNNKALFRKLNAV